MEGDHLCQLPGPINLGPLSGPFPPGPFPRAHLPTPPFSNLNFTLLSCLKIRRRSGGRPPLPAAQGGSLWGGFFQGGCCVEQLFMLLPFLMESLLRSGYQPPISCQLSGWIFPHSAPFRLMLSSCPNQILNSWKAISCLFPEGSSPNFLMERTFLRASSCGSAFARLVGEAFPEGSSLFRGKASLILVHVNIFWLYVGRVYFLALFWVKIFLKKGFRMFQTSSRFQFFPFLSPLPLGCFILLICSFLGCSVFFN